MHKNATKCNKTLSKWYKNKHGASKIMDTLETYQNHIALLTSESKAPGVVDRVPGGLDVLASFTDVVDGAVILFAAALKGDACVFRSALDDLAAGLPTRRRCGAGSYLLGLGGIPISDAWGVVPRRRSGSPAPWAPPWAGSSLEIATSSVIRARHPSRPSVVG
jgi:hypothetical protein